MSWLYERWNKAKRTAHSTSGMAKAIRFEKSSRQSSALRDGRYPCNSASDAQVIPPG
jgi:hypothetical protein